MKACNGRSACVVVLPFNSPQNCFGLCFSISGRVNCMCALLFLHCWINCFNASWVCACILPFCFTAFLYRARASLQRSLNHGARCLAHLLGFFDVRLVVTLSTPAVVASARRNSSILAERRALSAAYAVVMAVKASANAWVDVCLFHVAALALYSFRQSPSIQRYVLAS